MPYLEYPLNINNKTSVKSMLIEYDAGYISPDEEKNKKFITELNKIEVGEIIISEPLTVVAILQKYGIENRNGRIYPKEILIREDQKYQELIRERRAIGENDHPESSIISVERVATNITRTWWEGNVLMGELEVLMSPGFIRYGIISCQGDMIANLLRKKIRIGVSSRGVGSLEEIGGRLIVQDDFELICWDVVTGPSTPGSWIFKSREEARPFMEGKVGNKNLLIDKLDKFLLK